MKVVAMEDIEYGEDAVVRQNKQTGHWYARKAIIGADTKPNAVAASYIGQDEVCEWEKATGYIYSKMERGA